jgi:OOP family OmpA-OmpF porin
MRKYAPWAAFLSLALSACAGQSKPEANVSASANPPFTQALASEYRHLSDFEQGEHDWSNAKTFQRKADMAAAGQVPAPEDPTKRGVGTGFQLHPSEDIGKEQRNEAIAARERLLAALSGSGPQRNPAAAARAQASYDCWVEQLEEGWQRSDIERCRSAFNTAMAELGAQPVAQAPQGYNVYFSSGSAQVTSEGRQTIASAARSIQQGGATNIEVDGHADSVGSEAYNQQLSARRAEAVKQELAAAGVPADRITTRALGEHAPAVHTPDGVSNQENRRTVIQFD